jgi:penicillin-binding protein 1A
MSVVSVEPPTGFVRALVGGRGFDPNNQLNIALGSYLRAGGSGRQTGSSFKPFVLAEAFEQGISPNKTYSGAPHVTKDKTFENYGGAKFGTLTLRQATKKSVNTVFTRLLNDVGVEKTMGLARDMGLETLPAYDPAKYGLGVALGAVEVSPLEMASAYGVFANRGVRQEPTPIRKVTDRDGKVLIDNTARAGNRVLKEEVADNVTDVLKAVLVDGTAAGRGIDRPAAGKTGTTSDNRDSWFVGYTPNLSTSVWMGYTIPRPMKNIKGVGSVTGGTHPARVWQSYMKIALKDVPVANFADPAPLKALADSAKKSARNGFDPGPRQYPTGGAEGGPYVVGIAPPEANPPTTTTTSPGQTTTTIKPTTTSITVIGNQQPP